MCNIYGIIIYYFHVIINKTPTENSKSTIVDFCLNSIIDISENLQIQLT